MLCQEDIKPLKDQSEELDPIFSTTYHNPQKIKVNLIYRPLPEDDYQLYIETTDLTIRCTSKVEGNLWIAANSLYIIEAIIFNGLEKIR
jgi:hypothetical protein